MKTININGRGHVFDTDGTVIANVSGADPWAEAKLLERIAAALRQRDLLDRAIHDMKVMYRESELWEEALRERT